MRKQCTFYISTHCYKMQPSSGSSNSILFLLLILLYYLHVNEDLIQCVALTQTQISQWLVYFCRVDRAIIMSVKVKVHISRQDTRTHWPFHLHALVIHTVYKCQHSLSVSQHPFHFFFLNTNDCCKFREWMENVYSAGQQSSLVLSWRDLFSDTSLW